MSNKTKIVVFHLKELIYTAVFAGLGVLLAILLCWMFQSKDDAKEVKEGFECGINIENFNDIRENDIIEGYEMVEKE